MDLGKDFKKFAKSEGISSLSLHQFENGLTPYILEERELRATQIDVFSRLLRDRIIWVSGVVNQQMSDIVQAQLLYLDQAEKKDINMYINSPGGSVMNGLGIYDVMNYISCDVATMNLGMCASMGSILLSSGKKEKRSSLVHSKVMTHQVSHGTQGNIQDTRINQMEAEKYNYILFQILADNCGRTFQEVLEFSRRDKWYNSKEALDFGLVDEVIVPENHKSIDERLVGFEDYYKNEVMLK
jgi:ATP-dependent Clp protease protease subunit